MIFLLTYIFFYLFDCILIYTYKFFIYKNTSQKGSIYIYIYIDQHLKLLEGSLAK
jgi:hypothetical protein